MSHCLKRLGLTSLIAVAVMGVAAGSALALTIMGTDGHDRIVGSRGADTIDAKGGPDRVLARAGDDAITLGDGFDRARAGRGNDSVDGGAGPDVINAGPVRHATDTEYGPEHTCWVVFADQRSAIVVYDDEPDCQVSTGNYVGRFTYDA